MKQVLTVACRIEVPSEVAPKLDATLQAFSDACTYINQTVDPKLTNKPRIQVNPAYTSQTCHACLHIYPVKGESYRCGKVFKCGHCGNHCDADENGSKMISIVGAAFVNLPRGSVLSCNLADHIRATESPRILCVG